MKIQEIFNEYIELLPYMVRHKDVFVTTTLYNSYIKTVFGDKEVSILLLTDYQNFANDLLSKKYHDGYISRDRVEQIIEILVSICRYAIKSNYGITENLPQQITLNINSSKEKIYNEDLLGMKEDVTFLSNLYSAMEHINAMKVNYFR